MSAVASESTANGGRPGVLGRVAQVWGILGVTWLLGSALVRLTPYAVEAVTSPLTPLQWALTVGYVLFMAHAEGYRGFQKQFSPRVVVRARWLAHHPTPLRVVLAPFFCMGLFHATKKRLIVSWSITLMVIGLIALVRALEQPWRGIVDAGVVVGLAWGLTAMLAWLGADLRGKPLPVPPDVPEGEANPR